METHSTIPKTKVSSCYICNSLELKPWGKKNSFLYDICKNCGVIFLNPIPQQVAHIYSDAYFTGTSEGYGYHDYDADKEAMREVFVDYLVRLEGLTGGREIFDIGAATGYFLDRARERGWKGGGVELSEYAARKAIAKGFNVHQGTVNDLKEIGQYDVVTMWDVAEHIQVPQMDFKKISCLVRPGGYLVINTPDSASLYAKIMGGTWHMILPPEHIFLYTKKSLKHLLQQHGFELVEYTKIGKKFSVIYVVSTLYHWLGWGIWRMLRDFLDRHSRFARISLPINLRDNMFIIARKVSHEKSHQ